MIKRFYNSLLIILMLVFACGRSNQNSTGDSDTTDGNAEIVFDTTLHNFGELSQGEKVSFTFQFVNQGDAPLIIQDVVVGCGCTVAAWPKEPLQPGEKNGIEIIFDTSGRRGTQYKTIQVHSNARENEKMLVITADIKADF